MYIGRQETLPVIMSGCMIYRTMILIRFIQKNLKVLFFVILLLNSIDVNGYNKYTVLFLFAI